MRVIYCRTCHWVYQGDATNLGLPPRCECSAPLAVIVSDARAALVAHLRDVGFSIIPTFIGSMRAEDDE
jgi:hypothetical protein